MNIRDIMSAAKANAIAKGWYEKPFNVGEQLALVHAEVSEATEEARRHDLDIIYEKPSAEGGEKPCGFPIEAADVVIKMCELVARAEHELGVTIDLEAAIARKLAYNATRPRHHGDKRFG